MVVSFSNFGATEMNYSSGSEPIGYLDDALRATAMCHVMDRVSSSSSKVSVSPGVVV